MPVYNKDLLPDLANPDGFSSGAGRSSSRSLLHPGTCVEAVRVGGGGREIADSSGKLCVE